ncbi:M56 family metallopeptidase [Sphingomonas sp.]|uniref:M56 family metallopeptidase n=1 Tax=Sphingomonas sp. TaxID=28214 RepID=UPI0025D353B6|nr:M56 family metallopeptidase [Sphingomonas sp.]
MSAGLSGWAIETIVATTLLMLLVLAVRAPVRKAFGPYMAYALWLLPVLRMLMPPLPASWTEQAAAPVAAASDVIAYYVVEPIASISDTPVTAATASSINWLLIAGIAWAAGALLFLGYHLISHTRYCRNLLRAARVDRTVAEGRVRVIETDAAHGPLAFGVFRKYVAFPRDFSERYDEQERDLALAHELGHHVRGDLIANWVALIVLAIHWFNPVAWRAFRAFRADQEMACDALVLAGRAQALRHAYGRAIVKSAHGGAVSAACHLHTINEVKGRLRMLSKTGKLSPTRLACGLVGVSALSLAALGLTASGTQAAETIKNEVEAVTGVTLGQDVPAPPAPAAAPRAPAAPEAPGAPEAGNRHVERHVYRFSDDDKDGKGGKRVKKIVMVHADGTRTETEMPDIDKIMADMPQIRDGKCGGGGEPTVEHRIDGGKKVMIICTDRIERVTADATRLAMRGKRFGMQGALMSLRHARRRVEMDGELNGDERAKALKGIDEAIRELEKNSDKD